MDKCFDFDITTTSDSYNMAAAICATHLYVLYLRFMTNFSRPVNYELADYLSAGDQKRFLI